MKKQIINDIDRLTTLHTLGYEEGYFWPIDECRELSNLNEEGNVIQNSLVIECSDEIIKITKQFPIDSYCSKKGKWVAIEKPEVDEFVVERYFPADGYKQVYKLVLVEDEVPYKEDELGGQE